jgi:RNA polymerase-binding protein DksA
MTELSDQQLVDLKVRLRERATQLRSEIREGLTRSTEESHVRIAEQARDTEDDAFSNLIVDLNYSEIERDANELRRIDRALARVYDGSCGVCEECGGQIPARRLMVEPTATRCIRCQELHEKTHLS